MGADALCPLIVLLRKFGLGKWCKRKTLNVRWRFPLDPSDGFVAPGTSFTRRNAGRSKSMPRLPVVHDDTFYTPHERSLDLVVVSS